MATVELDSRYAPIPDDTKAILRQKTLLGETYVELTPGSNEAPPLPEGGSLPAAQVSDAVQLDEIFRAFDEPTRAAFQAWMVGQAAAFKGRGDDFSVTIASLEPFAEQADPGAAPARLPVAGGQRPDPQQRRGLRRALRAPGPAPGPDRELQPGLRRRPRTATRTSRPRSRSSRPSCASRGRRVARLEGFARDADPVVVALRPTAKEVAPTFASLGRLSNELDPFFVGLKTAIQRAPSGFSALRKILGDGLPPILNRLDPYLATLNGLLKGVRLYKHEITAFLGNATAATQGFLEIDAETNLPVHYLRTDGAADARGALDLSEAALDPAHEPVLQARGLRGRGQS